MGKGIHDFIKAHIFRLRKNTHLNNGIAGANCLLLACNHPRTSSFAVGRDQPLPRLEDQNVSPPAVDCVLKSIHANAGDVDTCNPPVIKQSSDRFVAVPVQSNSDVREVRLSAPSGSSTSGPSDADEEIVAVVTFSNDPYEDFRQSILEMVEARHSDDDPSQPSYRDFMKDLLFCYLELNDRTVHKYVVEAFMDLTVSDSRQSGKRKKMTKI